VIWPIGFTATTPLLIVAALEDRELLPLHSLVTDLGMTPLVEVHDQHDLARAIAMGAGMIGINNRDLQDFSVDLLTTEYLGPLVPDDVLCVSESGIVTRDDVERVGRADETLDRLRRRSAGRSCRARRRPAGRGPQLGSDSPPRAPELPVKRAHAVRALVSAALVLAMSGFGVGVFLAAGYMKAGHAQVQRPSQTTGPSMPGTVFVVQAGAIYRYQKGKFSQITSEAGWMQPAADPIGSRLVAVRRQANLSDLYLLDPYGRVQAQLTHDGSPTIEANHWAFYPRFSPDGNRLFYDYDPKDPYNSFRVDLAIFASPADPSAGRSVQWTYPNQYTGGDVSPVPLRGGGLIYTRFSIDDRSQVHSQVWYQARPGSPGTALTDLAADCLQPAVSSDERQLAMVCTAGQTQSAELRTALIFPSRLSLGPSTVGVRGQLVASPYFAPDGKSIAYLAPDRPGGGFQLWTVPTGPSTAPTPRPISSTLDLDAMSAPVWVN